MKNFLKTIIPMTFATVLQAAPGVILSPVDHLFIPKGFDNNDNVELVVTGKFPNNCHSRNKVEVMVKNDLIDVKVTALVSTPESGCQPYEFSYSENITVGNLQAGPYHVNVNGKLKDTLNVAEAHSESVDDHLYAQVDYVELGFTGGIGGDVRLIGRTTNCLDLDKIEIVSNDKDTYSVLPIMKKVSDSCSKEKTFFSYPVRFNPSELRNKNILLFVRTMDGKSVHSIVER